MDVNLEEEYLRGFVAGAKVPNAGEWLVIDSLALAELRAALIVSQAETAAAYEAGAQVAIQRKGIGSATMSHPYDAGYLAACDECAAVIRALSAAKERLAVWHDSVGNPMTSDPMRDLSAALTASQAETAAAYEAGRADALSGPWEDKPDVLTAAVEAAHPHYTKDYKTYTEALDLVSNRHGKGALVGLVNYLMAHNKAIISAIATPAARKAELDRMIADAEERGLRKALDAASDYTQRVYGDGWTFLSNPTDRDRIIAAIPKGNDNE